MVTPSILCTEMVGVLSVSALVTPHLVTASRQIVRMSASKTRNPNVTLESMVIKGEVL